jgi:hypothetical protein
MAEVAVEVEKAPGLFLAGNYLTGVGIEHATASGFAAAEKCLAYFFSGVKAATHENDDDERRTK